ncbi:efflux transporter outer membrane subunit [Marinimicrobium alkaliphilum]|uniref:efflux transporter outer membrane subunit n=1 Tax=Marinimicrobium alkaliphilum TaxID=2202654 RepID=UPI001E65C29B|nr:efflux transporter outer membrane subunit [Marinimicrobium alkaliphilum]
MRKMFTARYLTLAAAMLAISAGCARIDPIERPVVDTPASWQSAVALTDAGEHHIDPQWWTDFGSSQLNALIEEAQAQSPELDVAYERLRQAQLRARSAGSSLFPSLNLGAGTSYRRDQDPLQGGWFSNETTSANLGVSYELDLWGGVAASRRAAEASFMASEYDYVAANLSLTGAVASAWFEWLALAERVAVARENLALSERVLQVVDARYRNGAASAADLARQQTNVLSQRANLPPLEFQAKQTRRALAVLLGRVPQDNDWQAEPLADLQVPTIDPIAPAELLLRRPDLARAEAQLQSADANVAVARTAFLPSVSLSAMAGLGASGLFTLSDANQSRNVSLSLSQAIFDGGQRRAQRGISESQQRELVAQYRGAILDALRETDDALGRVQLNETQEQSQADILEQAERTLHLTEVRYREGSDELLTLIDAQRSVFQAREQLIQARLSRLIAAVDLYKALGGGWHPVE